VNFSTQTHDFNPGFGPPVNTRGDRTFWTIQIPDKDVKVDFGAGKAEMHVRDLHIEDYFNFPNASADGPEVDATVSFDVVWNGPITRRYNVTDAANGFAGSFVETQVTVTWSAHNDLGFRFVADPGTFATSVPEAGPIALLGQERNGTFFPGGSLMAAAAATAPVTTTLAAHQVEPLLAEALARWQAAGVDTSVLGPIDIRIADFGGATLGLAAGHTIWLDDNAAGWGWFVDSTPGDDSEFTTPGNQGEQHRMDLLSVLEHEVGHLLGHDHDEGGVMQETLDAGTRRTVAPVHRTATDRVDALFASLVPDTEAPWSGAGPFVVGKNKR
jgi:hypothetical protein